MKLAFEIFSVLSLIVNVVYTVVAFNQQWLRHPKHFMRVIAQCALTNLYQLRARPYTRTAWFNLISVAMLVFWSAIAAYAFAHGWTLVGMGFVSGMLYALLSEAMIALKPLPYGL